MLGNILDLLMTFPITHVLLLPHFFCRSFYRYSQSLWQNEVTFWSFPTIFCLTETLVGFDSFGRLTALSEPYRFLKLLYRTSKIDFWYLILNTLGLSYMFECSTLLQLAVCFVPFLIETYGKRSNTILNLVNTLPGPLLL